MHLPQVSPTKAACSVAVIGVFASTAYLLYKAGKLQLPGSITSLTSTAVADKPVVKPEVPAPQAKLASSSDGYFASLYNLLPSFSLRS